jgi:hypothetical protein
MFAGKFSNGLSIFVIFAVSVLGAGQVYAQVAGATLSGTVKDASGAFIPNAQVAITDVATGVTRTVSPGSAGLYTAPNLLPGTYEVRVSATGFRTAVEKGMTLTVGAQQVLDITMQVGQMSQTVEVTTEAPTVELTSSTLSAEVNATTVRELPLNGRSWTDLTNLQPGVVTAESHQGGNNRGEGAQVSISGARPQQSNYRLDGISINDYANGGPGSLLGGNLGVDAIQEFSVLTSNYSAEYGKTSGGVVNAITRSGTNQFHGSAYEFLRNSALDARNFFDGPTVPPFKRNQFGASAGAPIRKDRTFIFGDYEGIRQSLGTTADSKVLSPDARNGILNFSDPSKFPSGCTPTSVANQCQVTVDSSVAKYLGLEPSPNAGLLGIGNTGLFAFAGQQVVAENFFTIRMDQKISEKNNLFGTYSFDDAASHVPNALNNVLTNNITKRQFIALEESHVFSPTLGNTIRIGFHRDRVGGVPTAAINPVAADTSLGWVVGAGLTAPAATVTGLDSIGSGVGPTSYRIWNSYQVYDDAFLTRGLHSLKFGFGFERDQLNELDLTGEYQGGFAFGSLANFLTNNPSRIHAAFPGFVSPRGTRQSIFGVYLQDDWRWRRNLTLNLGLRYEMSTVPTEAHGKLTNLHNLTDPLPFCGIQVTGCAGVSPYFSNPTFHNFEPRVGFSWDPFRKGKTAVRGGFGMFDVLPMLYTQTTMVGRGAPFFQIGATKKASILNGNFPSGVTPGALGPSSLEYEYIEHNTPRNYVMQWNLNVQHEIMPNLTAVVGYVGSRGVHQALRVDDADIVLPTLTSAGYLWPNPITTGLRINENAGAIRLLNWPGDSFYDSLQVGIVKKMSHGLQVQGSYTWGKSIDNNSGATNGDTLGNSFSSIHWFDLRLSRAVSDYNIGRVLVINGIWQLPTSKSASRALAFVANSWELGAIFKVNDGIPITPLFGSNGDPLGLNSSDPFDFPNRLRGPGCETLTNPGNPNDYIKTQCFAVPTAPCPAGTDATTCPFYNGSASNGIGCDPKPPIGPKGAPQAVPFPQCFNLRGNAGRNIMVGPGLTNLDFSLFKNNFIKGISENFNAQFRVEVFNILNHANFAPPLTTGGVPTTDIFDETGAPEGAAGLLTQTVTTSRQIQFALKFTW